jgi:ABC-2 type transport system ATP-binding protein
MDSAIRCEGLVKRYGTVVALAGLDLDVPPGTIFGFLGPNGAGKTTTVRLLNGLARPTAGRAFVLGMDATTGGMALRGRTSYLDQQPQFYGWMTARELLGFCGELYGMRGAPLRARVDEVLRQTGLMEAARRRVGGYSGGMRQRLGLAQALINRPEVVFLDEPASSLDPAGRRDVLELIGGLRGQATVFMSTHILADVERVCNRVGIVKDGRLVAEAAVPELQARYAQPIFLLEPEPGQAAEQAVLVALLRRQRWVADVTEDHGELRVVVDDVGQAGRALPGLIAEAGMALARLERGRPSLEEIFLRLVGDARLPDPARAEVAG